MFSQHVVTPETFAHRFVQLLPEYLPGVDTGAFEPTDRRRCWNKTLTGVLTVIGKEDKRLDVVVQHSSLVALKDQFSLAWQRDGAALLAMNTGWGDRNELEMSLQWLEAFKCPQKLFVYSCAKWQEAVLDQIHASLLRYPYHIAGEQYLFLNLVGSENRFHLNVATLDESGPKKSANEIVLRPVTGSPFNWNVRHGRQEKASPPPRSVIHPTE